MLNGRFEIEHEIGSGAMGTVFKGVDTQSGQPVAIKRLKADLINSAMLERFRREGEALHQLNHPNIVKFVDTFEYEGQHYLVLEYIDGGNLKDAIQQNTLNVSQIIDISLDIADALTRAHRLNIIHRDIKSANILIGNDGGVYLTDFGVAAFGEMPDLTETDAVVGTIPYLSPEILEGKSISEKSDIWAFGVVLYEMLIGERPFQGDHAGTLMRSILFDNVPDLEAITDRIPVALIDLIYRMLEKDPMFRIPSVRLVGVELEALKKGYVPYTPRQLKRDEPTEIIESRFSKPTPSRHILNNLPSALTPFVGREAELKELERLLSTERLVSIVAPGGMGKTRLALEAASGQLGQWADGVYFVDLAPISSSDAIPGKIAEATGFQFYEGVEPREQILSFLREKQMLLIMDNYEHLLDGVDMVSDILQTAPDVVIIATSREKLHLQGETLFTIAGMDFPDWETPEDALEYAAVKLFMQSAHRTNPAFELREEDLKYIARICRLVEGMPLGILLAASWVNILTAEEIAREIEQSLDFLETEEQNVPARQRSIRAVLDYSWQRLSQHEQNTFAAMSVFRDGFTRESAQAVTGANLRDLMTLVNQSMIIRQPDGRYTVHELMRQYAADHLTQNPQLEDETYDKHCRYYLNFLAERQQTLKTAQEFAILRELESEMENEMAAWYYGVDHRLDDLLGSAIYTFVYWYVLRAYHDKLRDLTEYAIDKVDGLLFVRVYVGFFLASLDPQRLHSYGVQALSIVNQPGMPIDDVLFVLGLVGGIKNDSEIMDLALKLVAAHDDPWLELIVYAAHRDVESRRGNHAQASFFADKSIKCAEKLGNRILRLFHIRAAGAIESVAGKHDRAIEIFRDAINIAREFELDVYLGSNLELLAASLAANGHVDEALGAVQESIAIHHRLGRRFELYSAMDTYAQILYNLGEYEEALKLFEQCYTIVFNEFSQHLLSKAFITNRLGFVKYRLGDFSAARQHFIDALLHLIDLPPQHFFNRVNTILGLAYLVDKDGLPMRALYMLYVVAQYPMPENTDTYTDEARDLTAKLEAELSPEEIETARQQAETYDLDSLIEELLAEYGE